MPGGKTHDAITVIAVIPAAAAVFAATGDIRVTLAASAAFLFGGLMFGPDLDTVSRQYSRWWIFRPLWAPYRRFFRHRSRWSHGFIFGTFFRVVYFFGVVTLLAAACVFVYTAIRGAAFDHSSITRFWSEAGRIWKEFIGIEIAAALFFGMWLGAASHTLTDIAGTYIKTGRVSDPF